MPHERPEDTLLENDRELDQWWERFIQEKTRSFAKSMAKQGLAVGGVSFTGAESNAIHQFSG